MDTKPIIYKSLFAGYRPLQAQVRRDIDINTKHFSTSISLSADQNQNQDRDMNMGINGNTNSSGDVSPTQSDSSWASSETTASEREMHSLSNIEGVPYDWDLAGPNIDIAVTAMCSIATAYRQRAEADKRVLREIHNPDTREETLAGRSFDDVKNETINSLEGNRMVVNTLKRDYKNWRLHHPAPSTSINGNNDSQNHAGSHPVNGIFGLNGNSGPGPSSSGSDFNPEPSSVNGTGNGLSPESRPGSSGSSSSAKTMHIEGKNDIIVGSTGISSDNTEKTSNVFDCPLTSEMGIKICEFVEFINNNFSNTMT